MALALRITGVPTTNGSTCWSCDNVTWWDVSELRKEFPFREAGEVEGYFDGFVVISLSEARELHDRFADKAHDWQKAKLQNLKRYLSNKPPETAFVVLWIYEWSSGL